MIAKQGRFDHQTFDMLAEVVEKVRRIERRLDADAYVKTYLPATATVVTVGDSVTTLIRPSRRLDRRII